MSTRLRPRSLASAASSMSQSTSGCLRRRIAQAAFPYQANGSLITAGDKVIGSQLIGQTFSKPEYFLALDARTGRVLWHHSHPIADALVDDASRHLNRGVAVWRDRVFMQTDNAHLLCLDARSGNLIWDVSYAGWNKNYGATAAPLIVKDKVIVGTSGGDDGVRGFVAAYDAASGTRKWRRWRA